MKQQLFCARDCIDPHTGKGRLADTGVTVCEICRGQVERDLIELPELYHQLLFPTRVVKGPTARRTKGTEAPGPMDFGDDQAPAAGDVRAQIRTILSGATSWLAVQHDITAPRVALHRNLTSAHSRSVTYRVAAQNGSKPETNVRQMIAANHAARLYSADLDNYDPVPSMASHVRKHVDTVLADPEAAAFLCARLDRLVRLARSRATPSPPPPGRIGTCTIVPSGEADPCGGSVRATPSDDWAICNRCKGSGPLNWWFEQFFGNGQGNPAATYIELSSWLSRRYMRPVAYTSIRKAVSVPGKHPPILRVGTNSRSQVLLDVASAQAHYDSIYGAPDSGRQQAGAVL